MLEWGRGIGISYWQFSTHKLDFAFDGSQIQPCGEVGGDFTEPHSFQPGGVVVLGGGDLSTRHSFICGALPGSQTTYPFIYHF